MKTTPQKIDFKAKGVALTEAKKVMIMVHGRGATAESILELSGYLGLNGIAYIAPQASQNTWYPYSFLAPIAENQPFLAHSLDILGQLQQQIQVDYGFDASQIYWLGFSQGACLALEFALRNPQKYGGIFALSGGMIKTLPQYKGSFEQTPVFLGCSDVDSHIPKARVLETAQVMQEMRAKVTTILYPNMPHTITNEEIEQVKSILLL